MKRKTAFITIMLLFLIAMTIPAFAGSEKRSEASPQIEYYADGSFVVIVTEILPERTSLSLSSPKATSGTTTYTYYNSNKVAEWDFILKGTFTYDGGSAKATIATTSYHIYNTKWKCSSRTSSKSGSIARGSATFKSSSATKNVSLGLKCSSSGIISAI